MVLRNLILILFKWCIITKDILVSNFCKIGETVWIHGDIMTLQLLIPYYTMVMRKIRFSSDTKISKVWSNWTGLIQWVMQLLLTSNHLKNHGYICHRFLISIWCFQFVCINNSTLVPSVNSKAAIFHTVQLNHN